MRGASRTIVLGVIVAAVLLAALLLPRLSRFFEIDACLDRGGSWNHAEARCRFSDGGVGPD